MATVEGMAVYCSNAASFLVPYLRHLVYRNSRGLRSPSVLRFFGACHDSLQAYARRNHEMRVHSVFALRGMEHGLDG